MELGPLAMVLDIANTIKILKNFFKKEILAIAFLIISDDKLLFLILMLKLIHYR